MTCNHMSNNITGQGNTIGAVGHHSQGVVGSSGQPNKQSSSVSKASTNKTALGVLIAKDHEWNFFKKSLRVQHINFTEEPLSEGGLTCLKFEIDGVECTASYASGMGWEKAKAFATAFVFDFYPTHVAIVGSCGGKTEKLAKAYMIRVAKYLDQGEVKEVCCGDEWYGNREVFRALGKEGAVVEDPDTFFKLFTSRDLKPTKNVEPVLAQYDVDCVEMEVASIWKTIPFLNAGIKLLPAFKGVSDNGDDTMRKENMQLAINSAVGVFVQYVRQVKKVGSL